MRIGKIILTAAAMTIVLVIVLVLEAQPSMAQLYPFCRSSESGQGDCRYDSLEQCQAGIAGTSGYCRQNYFLPPGPVTPSRRSRRAP